ncbi:hypothetical protein B5T_00223 [Alloalcanivorax dieselolei B5]|uniref:Uncharacterized protein n=1 Tax=Alcanivorax dieselolei (strain DSM 16502 / CGMCC 1.3690 / MCCC 1A00001 / B-5) TaxID=930169 RepID=K0C7M9_ALCDB|nr:hypothetical protein B5T_00223 [Alloalcanivorax dieselolei B5]
MGLYQAHGVLGDRFGHFGSSSKGEAKSIDPPQGMQCGHPGIVVHGLVLGQFSSAGPRSHCRSLPCKRIGATRPEKNSLAGQAPTVGLLAGRRRQNAILPP